VNLTEKTIPVPGPPVNTAFALLTFLFFLALFPSLFALMFQKWRARAKWIAPICAISMVASFVAFGITSDRERDDARGSKLEAQAKPADQHLTLPQDAVADQGRAEVASAAQMQPDMADQKRHETDEAEIFLSVYGPSAVDDTTAYDDPRPPIPSRFLEYQPERVRAIFLPLQRVGSPPPYAWWLIGVTDTATEKPITLDEADRRLLARRNARESPSFVKIKTFAPAMRLSVEDPAYSPIIRGRTNLPDGTRLSIAILRNDNRCLVEQTPSCFLAEAKTNVMSGEFATERLWISGRYVPGIYMLFTTTGQIAAQPEAVKRIVGGRAEYVTGPLVKWTGPTAPSIDFAALAQLGSASR
jgi:hypothetical protein